ncbi:FemAB-related protein, PEP-CTERM system-associated [Thiorhodococcus drewsii AZ1]|uniref:FemAB-related protein, PEP-CTERM system-associated n=1 Tax=Thiorhodococcus drewsii AZ1 TaxID=765913 RepID=G2E611_9GAMM|nr:FemAB family XrtA/PEP-CTERM system-associated protein [Thiorhodococcus drewsii]EGV28496.1 FemAB-related protein, PEP-CTERM system-associated [Thiorhodococcus drewsii AZ1]
MPKIHTLCTTDEAARWDAFVQAHPHGTFFHLSGWKKVLEQAFGHRTHFLFAEAEDGSVIGVLPLGHLKSRLFGAQLVSTPFCVYGGSLADSPEIAEALDAEARRLAAVLRVDYLELRYREPCHRDWPAKDLYVTFRKQIDPDEETNLSAIPRKQRAMVRKGIAAGLVSRIDEEVDRVHRLYAESVRNLGTPVFSHRYFRTLKEVFAEACECLVVEHDGRPVAGVLSFYFRDEVLPYYGGGGQAARALKANDFMYWELMRRAAERGVRVFDFGRSKRDTGSYDFKRNWGFEPVQLSYEVQLCQASTLPDLSPMNPKYRLLIGLWKRLPVPVSRLLGPFISRSLG